METLPPLTGPDWFVIALFFIVTLGIGLYFSRQATGSLTEYFVAGRKMTWWLAGTSIVATSFAADTPLVISGWMRTLGLERNWFWWGGIMGFMLCTFFYARLWRRSGILTDVEFNELRYGGAPASGLRIFHATYRALIQNTLVMCWVTLAMTKILEVTLNIPTFVFVEDRLLPVAVEKGVEIAAVVQDPSSIAVWPIVGQAIISPKITGIILCLVVATLYTTISGLWGVMATDFFQFCLAMTGTIVLMAIVLGVSGGPKAMVTKAYDAVSSGIVVNKAPIRRNEIDPNESEPLSLSASGLVKQDIHTGEWRWAADGLTEDQVTDRLYQAGISSPEKWIDLWKKTYALSEGKFADFSEMEKMLNAGILKQDKQQDGSNRDYYRIPQASISEEKLLAQLDQADVTNKSEIMAAWHDDRVVNPRKITSLVPPQLAALNLKNLKGGALIGLWTFIVFIGLQWWAGGEGGGFLAQRLFSCKNEKHSVLAMLWFNFANFVLRPWPWIVVGVASIFLVPDVTKYGTHFDAEHAYVIMLMKYLPVGLKGLMVAALMAAYMSTISTHVNFGASYVVNDLYKRFIDKSDNEKRSVLVSQIVSVVLATFSGIAAYYATNIGGLWLTMFELMSGAGIVILLRWYWWRISAWSELAAMFSTLAIFGILNYTTWVHYCFELAGVPIYYLDEYAVRFTINFFFTTAIWVVVTFLTPPEKEEVLVNFYKRVRPAGLWSDIPRKAGNLNHLTVGWLEWFSWFLGVTGLFAMIFCVGKACFGLYLQSFVYAVYSVIATITLFKLIAKMDWSAIESMD